MKSWGADDPKTKIYLLCAKLWLMSNLQSSQHKALEHFTQTHTLRTYIYIYIYVDISQIYGQQI